MLKDLNFLLVGVGGQGIILASNIIADVGLKLGLDVKKSEVHGMSQRGGSVESHVRWGEKVYSPLAAEGETDYIMSMEILESARWGRYLRRDGVVLINNHRISPLAVTTGQAAYPADEVVLGAYTPRTSCIHFVDGSGKAKELGNPAVAGVVLLGYLASLMDVDEAAWLEVIKQRVPAKFVTLNQKAFMTGKEICQK